MNYARAFFVKLASFFNRRQLLILDCLFLFIGSELTLLYIYIYIYSLFFIFCQLTLTHLDFKVDQ